MRRVDGWFAVRPMVAVLRRVALTGHTATIFSYVMPATLVAAMIAGLISVQATAEANVAVFANSLGIAYAVVFVLVWVVFLTPAPGAVTFVTTIADVVVFVLFFKAMSTYANRALSRGASAPPPAPSSAW